MIVELMFKPLFLFLSFLVSLVPSYSAFNGSVIQEFYKLVGYGLYFCGSTNFILVLGSVVMWSGIQLAWAIIEWIYKKIPGVS